MVFDNRVVVQAFVTVSDNLASQKASHCTFFSQCKCNFPTFMSITSDAFYLLILVVCFFKVYDVDFISRSQWFQQDLTECTFSFELCTSCHSWQLGPFDGRTDHRKFQINEFLCFWLRANLAFTFL